MLILKLNEIDQNVHPGHCYFIFETEYHTQCFGSISKCVLCTFPRDFPIKLHNDVYAFLPLSSFYLMCQSFVLVSLLLCRVNFEIQGLELSSSTYQ